MRRFRWWLSDKLHWLAYKIEPEPVISEFDLNKMIVDSINKNPEILENSLAHNLFMQWTTTKK